MNYNNTFLAICASLLLHILPSSILAQSGATPSSSAAFGKFIDIPVSHYTGVPNISVPLHTISEDPITVPISLQYHSAGIKVGELASNVGLGWQLMGGGMVSRTVQGIPDEIDRSNYKGYYFNGQNVESGRESLPSNDEISSGEKDGEPDLFYFYAPGISGKFVFNGDYVSGGPSITMIPESDIKIQEYLSVAADGRNSFTQFVITSPDGTKYTFGNSTGSGTYFENRHNTDGDLDYPSTEHCSGWHLRKIETHDGKNSIDYTYTRTLYTYWSLAPNEVEYKFDEDSGIPIDTDIRHTSDNELAGTKIRYNKIQIDGAILNSIKSRTCEIVTLRDYRFDVISGASYNNTRISGLTIKEGTDLQHWFKYKFIQGYFTDDGSSAGPHYTNRLRLYQVQKESYLDSSVNENPHIFSYSNNLLPHRLSKAMDHWGYFNGKTSNDSRDDIIPSSNIGRGNNDGSIDYYYFGTTGLRDPLESYTNDGILTKITYPTGGTTDFDYEINTGPDFNDPGAIETILFDFNNSYYTPSCIPSNSQFQSRDLTDTDISDGYIEFSTTSTGPCSSPPGVTIYFKVIQGSDEELITFNTVFNNKGRCDLKDIAFLTTGSVTFNSWIQNGNGSVRVIFPKPAFFNQPVGGLRIKKITTSDPLTTNPDIVKEYFYRRNFDDDLSSGTYIGRPRYGYFIDGSIPDYKVWAESYSHVPLTSFEGYHIGYSRVEEKLNGHGTNVYEFFNEQFTHPTSAYELSIPVYARIISGNAEITTNFNESGDVINRQNVDEYEPDMYFNAIGNKIRARKYPDGTILESYYNIRSRKPFRPKSVSNTADGVSTSTEYVYGDNEPMLSWNHLQPHKISTIDSEGKEITNRMWYTQNYTINTHIKNELNARHIITIPYYTQTNIKQNPTDVGNGDIVRGKQTHFGFYQADGTPNGDNSWSLPDCGNCEVYPFREWVYESNSPPDVDDDAWRFVLFYDKYDMRYGFVSEQYEDQWKAQPATFVYDSYGNLLEKKSIKNDEVPSATSIGLSTDYSYYPSSSMLKTKTQNDEQSMTYTYDQLLRPKTVTDDCSGTVTTYDYHFSTGASDLNYTHTKVDYDEVSGSELDILHNYTYTDGLGRTVQTVAQDQGPGIDDDIISHRTYNQWGQVDRVYEPFKKSGNNGAYVPSVTAAYSTKDYYTEPAGRLWRTKAAGWAYYTSFEYGHNIASDGTITIPGGSTFGTTQLSKTKVTDGNGNLSYTFTDKRGRTILKRRSDAADANDIDTYYHYDDKDRLIKVYPPGSTTSTPELIYTYTYNKRDQTLEKKVPGRAKMEYRYSTKGQLRYSRDGYLQAQNKWYAYQYDDYGREVKSGFYNFSDTPDDLDSDPATITDALTVNIYGTDNTRDEDRLKTVKSKILGTSTWLESTSVYDDCGRVTSSTGNNHLYTNLAAETMSTTYDWADNVLTDTRIHKASAAGIDQQTILNTYTYDHAGRLNVSKFKLNSETERFLSDLTYDHKNQIISNQVGSKNSGASYLQTMDYTYLENGLLQYINKTFVSSDLFKERLHYDTDAPSVNEAIQKNGNISAVESVIAGNLKRTYGFTYDHLDRLKVADYYGNATSSTDDYNVAISYDARGNITSLNRYGRTPASGTDRKLIDDLDYIYINNTNQFLKVDDDAAAADKSYGYNPKTIFFYNYDTNGNVKYDPSRGVTFTYNHLDLPVTADFGGGKTIEWLYDAGGGLLTKTVKQGTDIIDKRDYVGGIEYKDDVIDVIYHGEGRLINTNSGASGTLNLSGTINTTKDYEAQTINSTQIIQSPGNIDYQASASIMLNPGFEVKTGALFNGHIAGGAGGVSWEYQYTISDHLGNTRVVYADRNGDGIITPSTEIVESYDYYPFGLKMDDEPDGMRDGEAYQYNGIEYVEDHGLNYNMATYRCLDPALGRWMSIDPAAESSMSLSPYNSMNGNPVSYTDPEGDFPFLAIAIGMGIGALINTGTQVIANGGFNNWNWGSFAGSVVAGGVGGGVSSALTSAGIGGFYAGAITGATGGFTHSLTSGVLNNNLTAGGLAKSTLIGAGIGGSIQGIGDALGGKSFWNGRERFDLSKGFGAHNLPPKIGEKTITGKYEGTYEGVPVYESTKMGAGGVTLPGRGIIVGKGAYSKNLDPDLLMHEFGHILQAQDIGVFNFYTKIGPPSVLSASRHGKNGYNHMEFWTESWANYKSIGYFGHGFNDAGQYISRNISNGRYHQLKKFIIPHRGGF